MIMESQYKSYTGDTQIPQLLSAHDVAKILNVSRSFSYLLLQSGQIPTVRLGRSVRVRPQDLTEYIENNLHHLADNP
jgi:excisionase family DNA binding protein